MPPETLCFVSPADTGIPARRVGCGRCGRNSQDADFFLPLEGEGNWGERGLRVRGKETLEEGQRPRKCSVPPSPGPSPSGERGERSNSLSSNQANFDGTSPYGDAPPGVCLGRPCAVGSYPPNAFGLYDMHGNVWEWCHDWYAHLYYHNSPPRDPPGPAEGTFRVLRGGGWRLPGDTCRAAYRNWDLPSSSVNRLGFRVVLVQSI